MIYKVYYKKYGKKNSMIIRTSSSYMAAKLVLNKLTTHFDLLGEIEITCVRIVKN
jgi:DNA-dependent RNA polymerase auxiliary subunit epsilon